MKTMSTSRTPSTTRTMKMMVAGSMRPLAAARPPTKPRMPAATSEPVDITSTRIGAMTASVRETRSSVSRRSLAANGVDEQTPPQPHERAERSDHRESQSSAGADVRSAPTSSKNRSSSVWLPDEPRSSAIGPCATSRPRLMMPM